MKAFTGKNIQLAAALALLISMAPGCGTNIRNAPLRGSVDLQGHRGARGLRPENSIPAFIYCIEQGMDTIELDTNLTRDGRVIVYHDTELNEKLCLRPDGKAARPLPVKSLTVAELKQYDCGAIQHKKFPMQKAIKGTKMITLDEFFAFVKDYEKKNPRAPKLNFNIEIKFPQEYEKEYLKNSAAAMAEAVNKSGMVSRTTIQSFVMEVLPPVKEKLPTVTISALFKPNYWKGFNMMLGLDADRDTIIKKAMAVQADIISPYHLYVTPEFVKKCHDRKMRVIPWTVNEKKKIIKMLNAGVDGIISDYPKRLKGTYTEWKNLKTRGNE